MKYRHARGEVAAAEAGVSGRVTKYVSALVGMKSSAALAVVQLRPPNRGTAKV